MNIKKTLIALTVLALGAGAAFAETVNVKVKGMVCSFCAHGLDKKFGAEPAVEEVSVSLKESAVVLTLKEGEKMSDKRIRTLVEDAGYAVEEITRPAP